MFRLIKRLIKLTLLIIIAIMIYLIVQNNPFTQQPTSNSNATTVTNGKSYTLEDNALFQNIPLSQVRNVFNFMDKQEFMDVSGLSLMGYNDTYLIGLRGNDYIMYRFGERQVTVFQNEADLYKALAERQQNIQMKDRNQY
ncbi:DUF4930 family protein [Macrococcus capreoli]